MIRIQTQGRPMPVHAGRLVLVGLLACVLAACAGAPKKEKLGITLQATEDVNPDQQGRPSPIVVHVLELKSAEQFNSLDYRSLTDPSNAALAADLVNRHQEVLAPGGSKMLDLQLEAGTTAIGLVAGYRDIDHADWRKVVPIAAGSTKSVTVVLEQFTVNATTAN